MKKNDNSSIWVIVIGFLLTFLLINNTNGEIQDLTNKVSSLDQKVTSLNTAVNKGGSGEPSAPTDMTDLMDDDAIKGDVDAPVTIVEWSDYECPFCARFYSQTYLQIVENYIDTGKAKLVFRDYPLNFHANAQKAAEAAECAGEQNKYYEMHDLLFEKGVKGGVATFKGYAKNIGLDQSAFDACLDSGKMAEEVKADMTAGQLAGIKGTPGFIINGQLISGAQPYSVFAAAIDKALN